MTDSFDPLPPFNETTKINDMPNFKASYKYENGVLMQTFFPERISGMAKNESIPIISIIGGIQIAMAHFPAQYKITGIIYIESKDGHLFIRYAIAPADAILPIQQAIGTMYTVQQN